MPLRQTADIGFLSVVPAHVVQAAVVSARSAPALSAIPGMQLRLAGPGETATRRHGSDNRSLNNLVL
jgi:hypothetical protein